MSLHTEVIGSGPRLVLAHGFTQNGRCWGRFAERLAERFEVVLVDLPGHGRSHHDDAHLWEAADLLVEVGGEADYLGYSMGGRIALHAALTHPDEVRGLITIGATAGIDGADDRAARRTADAALADRLLADGLPAFLDRWLASPLFAGLSADAACRTEREANRPEGLASSLRRCGTGSQLVLWPSLADVVQPFMAIAGSEDRKFTALAERLVVSMGGPTQLGIETGTHAVHLENPDQVASVVGSTIDSWRSV